MYTYTYMMYTYMYVNTYIYIYMYVSSIKKHQSTHRKVKSSAGIPDASWLTKMEVGGPGSRDLSLGIEAPVDSCGFIVFNSV